MLDALLDFSKNFAAEFGLLGGFAISFAETIFLPLFPDPLIALAPSIGLNSWVMAAAVSFGTLLGSIAGFWLGKWLGHPAAVKLFGEKGVEKGERSFEKWGAWGVVGSGLTPVPYKIFVWLAGILEMRFSTFLLAAAAGRVPRFFFVAWLAERISGG